MEYNFIKKGIEFRFRNPAMNEYDELTLEFKIPGILENERTAEGYYYNAKFNRKDGIMFYSTVDVIIDGKAINGVIIPENYAEELKTIYQTELKTRKETFNKVVDEIISGERLINWELVGYEYHNYQPWLRNLPKCLDRKEQDLMKAAVEKYIGEPVYGNICDYLEKKLDQGITFKENLNEKAVNVELNKDTKAREELRDEIVTHFDLKLEDIITDLAEIKERQAKEEKERIEREKRKASMKVTVLSNKTVKGPDGDDLQALVSITDGKETLEFVCRNIFDVGFLINPNYKLTPESEKKGGLPNNDNGQLIWMNFTEDGWINVREMTDFEKRCVKYLEEFSPINTEFRM